MKKYFFGTLGILSFFISSPGAMTPDSNSPPEIVSVKHKTFRYFYPTGLNLSCKNKSELLQDYFAWQGKTLTPSVLDRRGPLPEKLSLRGKPLEKCREELLKYARFKGRRLGPWDVLKAVGACIMPYFILPPPSLKVFYDNLREVDFSRPYATKKLDENEKELRKQLVGGVLRNGPFLQKLNLSNNDVDDRLIEEIFSIKTSKPCILTQLDLSYNQLALKSKYPLDRIFRVCLDLKALDLRYNKISYASRDILQEVMGKDMLGVTLRPLNFQKIELEGNPIQEDIPDISIRALQGFRPSW